jgi:hypothetical protein
MDKIEDHSDGPEENRTFVERRKEQRIRVTERAIASLNLTVVGQIVNISCRGLAFRYVASHERSKESSSIKISLNDNTFTLGMIPFEALWDAAMPQSFSCGDIALRYCGGVFRDLEDFQRLALSYFVKQYRVDSSEDQ